ncbi:DUF309 domain-containing protein [Ureibacillus manganicus]|uniref:DUF309 domain-containing protein n=1 Tax=Ureibacillus manganicus DSM 26584 TaxID=1384049 RepID=A0A0A3I4D2_9BACL|nr:DUF309 domain-containing protein [Ureibacillus manganicus]KGR79599.1 hypothetical protein CD29_05730 [Ureibacillus manganicus DSM 26584]
MHSQFHPLFIDYLAFFNGNQDYFECHEVLEDYWKKLAPGEKNHPLVGYIQLATGMYHWRRQNLNGALRILRKAYDNFQANKNSEFFEHIDFEDLIDHCLKSMDALMQDCPFVAFQLQVTNSELKSIVAKKIEDLPNHSYHFLLNKHMLRDRSDILNEREIKRNLKNRK